jgi:hypothetical protein
MSNANNTRRDFLIQGASVAAVAVAGASLSACGGETTAAPSVFAYGVASGDPLTDRVILWTRLQGARRQRCAGRSHVAGGERRRLRQRGRLRQGPGDVGHRFHGQGGCHRADGRVELLLPIHQRRGLHVARGHHPDAARRGCHVGQAGGVLLLALPGGPVQFLRRRRPSPMPSMRCTWATTSTSTVPIPPSSAMQTRQRSVAFRCRPTTSSRFRTTAPVMPSTGRT